MPKSLLYLIKQTIFIPILSSFLHIIHVRCVATSKFIENDSYTTDLGGQSQNSYALEEEFKEADAAENLPQHAR